MAPTAESEDRIPVDPIHLALVRLDGKIDTLIKTQAVRESALNAELQRIRDDSVVHARDYDRRFADQETRIRNLEGRRYVEPRTVWAAAALLLTVGSLVVAIINLTIGK